MTKKGWLVVAAIVVIVALAVAAVVISRHGTDGSNEAAGQSESASNTEALGSTTTTADAVVETTTTVLATTTTINPALNPSKGIDAAPVTFRSPQRCTKTGEPTGTLPDASPLGGKKWVTVGHISGSCDVTSSSFNLKAVETRLAWRSDATNFNAFVLSKAGLDATAGYADADCQSACSEAQAVVLEAGSYVLRVQADGGPWEVAIQEFR